VSWDSDALRIPATAYAQTLWPICKDTYGQDILRCSQFADNGYADNDDLTSKFFHRGKHASTTFVLGGASLLRRQDWGRHENGRH
jgi:hypothetical protein